MTLVCICATCLDDLPGEAASKASLVIAQHEPTYFVVDEDDIVILSEMGWAKDAPHMSRGAAEAPAHMSHDE